MEFIIRNEKWLLISYAVVAFIVYQVFNFYYLKAGFNFPDEDRFFLSALKFSQTGEFWTFNYRQWDMPGVAIIYSPLASIFSAERDFILATRVFHSILLIVNAILLYKISYLIFESKLASIFTFIVTLCYPFFVYYQGLILSENLFIFFLVAGFYMLFGWSKNGFPLDRYFYGALIFLTTSVYMKATLTILPPLLVAFFYFMNEKKIFPTLKVLLISVVVYVMIMSPWWVRSYDLFDKVVPFTSTSTMNMYLGNNPSNKNGGCDWATDAEIKLYSTYEISESEYMNIYTDATKKFIQENPQRFVELMWLKFKRFWNVTPNHEKYNKGKYKYLSLMSYGVVLFLAIISFFIYYKRFKDLVPIYTLFLYFTVVHIVTIASIRYRLPIEPFLIVLASGVIAFMDKKVARN